MNWDDLGDELERINDTGDRDYRIGEYRRLLTELSPADDGFAEVLTNLADDLTMEGLLEEAEAAYQQAVDDGGRTVLDPRVGLLDIALRRGDDVQADEILAELLARSRADQLVIGDYEWIGESLEEAGRLRAALRWLTIPLRDIQPGDLELMPVVCLDGRWRVRRALDLPIDAYDEAREVWHEVNAVRPGAIQA